MTFSKSRRYGKSSRVRLRAGLRLLVVAFPSSLPLLSAAPGRAQPAPPPTEPTPAPAEPAPEDPPPETPAEPQGPESPSAEPPAAESPPPPDAPTEPAPTIPEDPPPAEASDDPPDAPPEPVAEESVEGETAPKKEGGPFRHFFDHFSVRGYAQLRFNNLVSTNDRLVNLQGDRSMGGPPNFFFRRIRLVLSGDLHPLVRAYFQTDFANAVSSENQNFAQVRDWYVDLHEPSKQVWMRVGQSKVPYGFENMQSSQNRLPLDRSDAINSALANERDIGLFLYYAPTEIRKRFEYLVKSGLKGSGDYGVIGVGVYNGQTSNHPERNDNKHIVARIAYPFRIGGQIVEPGLAGYTGRFVIQKDENVLGADEFRDQRLGAQLVLYPQPLGIQVEYNVGRGPEFQALLPSADPDAPIGEVEESFLHGGYALVSLKLDRVIPYVRGMLYEGGKKHERNAPKYSVREMDVGIEWQVIDALELLGEYVFADRTFPEFPYPQEQGSLLRMQLQINY